MFGVCASPEKVSFAFGCLVGLNKTGVRKLAGLVIRPWVLVRPAGQRLFPRFWCLVGGLDHRTELVEEMTERRGGGTHVLCARTLPMWLRAYVHTAYFEVRNRKYAMTSCPYTRRDTLPGRHRGCSPSHPMPTCRYRIHVMVQPGQPHYLTRYVEVAYNPQRYNMSRSLADKSHARPRRHDTTPQKSVGPESGVRAA